jgi:hypothetical protein
MNQYALDASGGLALFLLVAAVVLSSKLKAARAALAEAERALAVPPPPPPPVTVEGRREAYGLLWFPTLTVDETRHAVVGATAGLPHCPRCVRALSLKTGTPEEWVCEGCGEKRAASAADIRVTDTVLAEALKEFMARRGGGYRLDDGVSAPKTKA